MPATYTFDIFCTLDRFGSYGPDGDWGGYWGKQGPEFIARRLEHYGGEQHLVLGATTYRDFTEHLPAAADADPDDPNTRIANLPLTVVSSTLGTPLAWPGGATVAAGDAVDIVTRLKQESSVPLRSHGSLTLNRSLMAAGLVDRVQVTVFPVISGRTGARPIFEGADDFDLELLEARTLDGRTQELTYRPSRHP